MSSAILPLSLSNSCTTSLTRISGGKAGNQKGSLPGSRTDLQASPGSRYSRPGDAKKQQRVVKGVQERRGVVTLDPASYRNSKSHNLCVQLLEDGYHESFVELFQLFQYQRKRRDEAEPGSLLSMEPLVENDSLKLDHLRTYLTASEYSKRIGDLDAVYMGQRSLAQHFDQTGDTWLSDHFHNRCLQTSLMIKSDNRKKEGEAHCNVGLSLENRGELQSALSHLETFYQLARRHKWHTESGEGLHEVSCEHLRRVYTSIADQMITADYKGALQYLTKALEMSKEGGDLYQEGLAYYRLGGAYEKGGEVDSALKCYRSYFERCKHHGDARGMGQACQALANTYENQGDLEKAAEWLELFVDISESSEQHDCLMNACNSIGTFHNTLGNFDKACTYFKKCYELSKGSSNPSSVPLTSVHFGVASAHVLLEEFSERLNKNDNSSMQTIVSWKESRSGMNKEDRD